MGLKAKDLRHMLENIFEIDSYASKMGDDKNIVTLSFSLKDSLAAQDLTNFLEKGYEFILDADATPGEQSDGTYKVFVEIERNQNTPEQIFEIMDGIQKLSGEEEFKFRYYKGFRSYPVNMDTLQEMIPTDPENYGITVQENKLNNYKEFFNRGYLESVDMVDDILTIKKKYADPISFKFVDFGDKYEITESLTESFNVESYPEILFLTKYLGDYGISKYGEDLLFENSNKVLKVRRL
jgi:hypothetical protein